MKTALLRLTCLWLLLPFMATSQIPLVYTVENTGSACTPPAIPDYAGLPTIQPLPDPFVFMAPGKGRSTAFADWSCRRNEIKASIEKYEIGPKPGKSDLTITALYTPGSGGGTLSVTVLRNSNGVSLTLTTNVNLPAGTPPPNGWPALIGMSLAPSVAPLNSHIAKLDFMHDQVTTYAAGAEVTHVNDPYFLMYPEYYTTNCPGNGVPCQTPPPAGQVEVGQYSAWAWGVSRLIDGMEIAKQQLVNPLPIDIQHLGVNGCSYAGKMALFSGAFDERIAATFAQESGGGGAPAWRVSHAIEPDGSVEKASNTNGNWFKRSMKSQFAGNSVYKFPHDHHELMAMVAPRALFISGNTDFTWLSNRAAYVTARATQKIFDTLGVGDRFGYWIDGNHGHCALGAGQQAVIDGFYNKFLRGQNIEWDVHVYPQTPAFTNLDYERWTQWWGTGNPIFPPEPEGRKLWLEPECGTVGANWQIVDDAAASNGKYVTVQAGLNSTASAPAGDAATVVVPFYIDSAGMYNIKARVNCPSADDDSYWVKIDDGAFVMANGLTTSGWDWVTLTAGNLAVGGHTLTIAYREDGALLDKILITTSGSLVTGMGEPASNCGAVLPVSIIAFDGALNAGKVQLQWQTANEENVRQYVVEKSTDGQHFTTVGTVTALAGRAANRYQFTDALAPTRLQYYRLKIIDNQGTYKYSKAIAVTGATQHTLQVLPNPVKNTLYATHAQVGAGATINIVSASGARVLQQRLQAQSAQTTIETSALAPGVYVLQLVDNGQVRTSRFVKQ